MGLILLIAFILQSFSPVLIYGDYYLSREAYLALCVNKDKPEMHCEGHCQMTKEMEKEQSRDKNNLPTNTGISVVYFIADCAEIQVLNPPVLRENDVFPWTQDFAVSNQPKGLFRPPRCC